MANGRPWFSLDKSKDPEYVEKQIILEMLKQENQKEKHDIELEQRTKHIRENYEKKGLLSDKIFDALDGY